MCFVRVTLKSKYRVGFYEFQWILNLRIIIREVPDDDVELL